MPDHPTMFSRFNLLGSICACIATLGSVEPMRAGTITFNSATTSDYLDVTIDFSDGYVQAPTFPDDVWRFLQYDGIYGIRATNEFGWIVDASYSSEHNKYSVLYVRPPTQYFTAFIYIGDTYVEQWSGNPENSGVGFGGIAISQLQPAAWAESGRGMPNKTSPARNVTRITWNVPDSGSSGLLLGSVIVMLAAVRHRFW
jgi:hypothetical protein